MVSLKRQDQENIRREYIYIYIYVKREIKWNIPLSFFLFFYAYCISSKVKLRVSASTNAFTFALFFSFLIIPRRITQVFFNNFYISRIKVNSSSFINH